MDKDYKTEIEEYRAKRKAALTTEDGWLTLCGFDWLKEGDNLAGNSKDADIKVPKGPAKLCIFTMTKDGKLSAKPIEGSEVTCDGKKLDKEVAIESDASDKPVTKLQHDTLTLYVVKRSGQYGVRIKDSQAATRLKFGDFEHFPIDENLRVTAKFSPYKEVKTITIDNAMGMKDTEKVPGLLTFVIKGQKLSLEPVLESGTEDLFVIFKDKTSGKQTYGMRYVYAKKPDSEGNSVLDFNKAYNPPCSLVPFATCTLPWPANRLPIEITAGELIYKPKETEKTE